MIALRAVRFEVRSGYNEVNPDETYVLLCFHAALIVWASLLCRGRSFCICASKRCP